MEANKDVDIRLRQQALIAEFGLAALRSQDLQSLLDMAARLTACGLGSDFAKVLEHLPGENTFLVRAGVGWHPGVVGHARIGGEMESPAGYAFRTGRPVIANALASERRFQMTPLLAEHGVRRAVNVIIRGESTPYGVLEADKRDGTAFTPDDVNFLQAFANTLGAAMDREHTRQEMSRLAALAEARAQEAEEALRARDELLRQKDLLMREIDHRVKNSLTVTRSLLAMQSRLTQDSSSRALLEEAAQRVSTIARVHDRLYRSSRIGQVDLADYLQGLCEELHYSSGLTDAGRPLHVAVEVAEYSADDAVSIGLIVTELLTNAAKYGAGPVDLQCRRLPGGGLRLTVCDAGHGLPPDFAPAEATGLGMVLIHGLSQKLSGTLRWSTPESGIGLLVTLELPPPPAERGEAG
ncbi:histidine kinase dimerization/phosphoacceptor domain -containing protein [Roseomonas sp. E05]|uniref:sensor histidine kinase n=1 Tax=Roseomonas sp. E05 TaxID=3046310 RepID=UPI0024BBD50E|nr:histidine kinase dimerization/phosphoacceptor domain -containing protein [Roseomonas sp. E05]MDJ0388176.1 histidine kinase dimerization/phosphoacceptor domain -containing protein [Roseomonas sp. E05]